MQPGTFNIEIIKGTTFGFKATGEDDIGAVDYATIYDYAELKVYPSWKDADSEASAPMLSLSTTTGEIVLTATSVDVSLSIEDTANIPFTEGTYILVLGIVDPLGVDPDIIDPMLKGTFKVDGRFM